MNWLYTAWIVQASASATLGLLHLFIWRAHIMQKMGTPSVAALVRGVERTARSRIQ